MNKYRRSRIIILTTLVLALCLFIGCDAEAIRKTGKFMEGFSKWNLSDSIKVKEEGVKNTTSSFIEATEEEKIGALDDLVSQVTDALEAKVDVETIKSVLNEKYDDGATEDYRNFVSSIQDVVTGENLESLKDLSPELADAISSITDSIDPDNPTVGDIATYYMFKSIVEDVKVTAEEVNQTINNPDDLVDVMKELLDKDSIKKDAEGTVGKLLEYTSVMSVIYGVDLSLGNMVSGIFNK